MCLVALAWRAHPHYRLVVAANRDEFHQRPAAPLGWWPAPPILAGRDLAAGGTWLALDERGRFATVTNYRETSAPQSGERSRGELVVDFVAGDTPALDWARALDGSRYAGYSLLAACGDELVYVSNRGDAARRLSPGVYGLSNASLDTPWPKLRRTRSGLLRLLDEDRLSVAALFELLGDRRPSPPGEGEAPGLPAEFAHALTAPFIVTPEFGTRSSTVVVMEEEGSVTVEERRFDPSGRQSGETRQSFRPR